MKLLRKRNLTPPAYLKAIAGIVCWLIIAMFITPVKACDRSQMTLDSVVLEGGNYRIYIDVCIGGGISGTVLGADAATLTTALGLYSTDPSFTMLNFTPGSISGDSTGGVYNGGNIGPLGAPFNTQATIGYSATSALPLLCVSSPTSCGTPHAQCDQYTFLTNVLPDSIRHFGAEGNGNALGGCYMESDMMVEFSSFGVVIDAGNDTLVCRGDTLTLGGNPTVGGSSYEIAWTPAASLSSDTVLNPMAWPLTTTTYVVTVTDPIGSVLLGTDSVTITVDTTCVWPGDCNYDYVANYLDILPIGLAYNFAGPIRPMTGSGWFAHPAYDWSGNFVNGTNHKHADSDGDGLVNFLDVLPILANYGQTHSGNRTHSAQTGGLYFELLPDSSMAGDTIWFYVSLGTAAQPADSTYGVAFQLFYPPGMVDSGGVFVEYNNSWLGTEAVDMICIEVDYYPGGVLEVGMTRIDHIDRSGFGEICRIGIAMQDNISLKKETISKYAHLRLDGGFKTSADENQRALSGELDSVLIWLEGPLLVNWQDFGGTALASSVQLDWSTHVETNSDYFQVERAAVGEAFESIGSLPAAGNAAVPSQYQFMDQAPHTGENIYRIVEADINGVKTYSSAISVMFDESRAVALTSPPIFLDDELRFATFSPKGQAANFQLFDLQGRELINQSIQLVEGEQAMRYPIETLSAGVYLFHLKTATTKITQKLILN